MRLRKSYEVLCSGSQVDQLKPIGNSRKTRSAIFGSIARLTTSSDLLSNHHHLSHKPCKRWPRSLTRYTTGSRPRSEVRFSASGSHNVALTAIARVAYCSEWYSVERRQQRGTNDCNSFRRYQMGAMDSRCQKLPATHKPRSQRQEASFR